MNLERSLPADGRNSGHYVQGHVDDTGIIAVSGSSRDTEGRHQTVVVGHNPREMCAAMVICALPRSAI